MSLNAQNQGKKNLAILEGSALNRLAEKIIGGFSRAASSSVIIAAATSYPPVGKLYENSAAARLLRLVGRPFSGLWRLLTKAIEESFIIQGLQNLFGLLLSISMFSWGVFLTSYGAINVSLSILEVGVAARELLLSSGRMIFGLVMILTGILVMVMRGSAADAIRKSAIMRRIAFGLLGFREVRLQSISERRALVPMVIASFILGIAGNYMPFWAPPAAIIAAVMAGIVLSVPETAVVLAFAAVPFFPTMWMAVLCILAFISYLLKYIRGKRILKIERLDIAVILFAVIMAVSGGLTSVSPADSLKTIAMYLLFIIMYFTTANTMLSEKWANKASVMLTAAAAVSALIGIYQYLTGFEASLKWVDTEMFSEIEGRVIGTFDNPNVFGEFLIMLIPLAFALMVTKKGMMGFGSFIAFCSMGLALALTFSRGAWLGFIISFAVFLFIYHKGFIKLALLGIAALPFLPAVLPVSILERITSIGNVADTSTAYRVSVWIGSLNLLEDYWFTGIGTGTRAFLKVYPTYALSGAGYAEHAHNLYLQLAIEIGVVGLAVFIALAAYFFKLTLSAAKTMRKNGAGIIALSIGAGIFGLLLQGLTDNVWYNYRIVLIFWMLVGLAVARSRGYRAEWGGDAQSY